MIMHRCTKTQIKTKNQVFIFIEVKRRRTKCCGRFDHLCVLFSVVLFNLKEE